MTGKESTAFYKNSDSTRYERETCKCVVQFGLDSRALGNSNQQYNKDKAYLTS
jgi:hypothetical protein